MPLILVTGLPSSGKTTTSKKLLQFFEKSLKDVKSNQHVRIVSDTEQLDWDGRNVIYNSIPKEKELRGWIRSEAQRYVNLNNIVILDVAAYIKGFRYELYCMTKEANTQYCVIECIPPIEECRKWKQQFISEQLKVGLEEGAPEPGYTDATFDSLIMRYEKCDDSNRWDSPLFRFNPIVDQLEYEEIFRIITQGNPLVPNKSTSLTQTTKTIYSENRDKMEDPSDETN